MKKVLVIGKGLLGSALIVESRSRNLNVHAIDSSNIDLTKPGSSKSLFELLESFDPDIVYFTAARVRGILGNIEDNSCSMYFDNMLIQSNVINAIDLFWEKNLKNKSEKDRTFVSFLSTCIYPDNTTYPLLEENIFSGEPHESNAGYAHAKRSLGISMKYLAKKYRNPQFKTICLIPNNLYGPNDTYVEGGHVIPDLIRKIHDLKIRLNNKHVSPLKIWGDGTQEREFTYSADLANIAHKLVMSSRSIGLMNVGNTESYMIRDVVKTICDKSGIDHDSLVKDNIIIYSDKAYAYLTGQKKKPMSTEKMESMIGKNFPFTSLESGIDRSINDFLSKKGKNN